MGETPQVEVGGAMILGCYTDGQGERSVQQAYVLTGSVADAQTVTLDEALPVREGRVRVVIEVLEPDEKPSYAEVMALIRARQKERGFVPPQRKEVDAYLESERESWDELP
jgi:hypothetical protein